MRNIFVSLITIIITLAGCASYHEAAMPFVNLGYTGDKIFPVAKNNAQFTFRAYINFSTDVDRIISVSSDTTFKPKSNLIEIRNKTTKHAEHYSFTKYNVKPKSGVKGFIAKIDSLNLLHTSDQSSFPFVYDQPFSLYIIEVREDEKYNIFRFNTHFPYKDSGNDIYLQIQKLILEEFDIPLYTSKEKNIARPRS